MLLFNGNIFAGISIFYFGSNIVQSFFTIEAHRRTKKEKKVNGIS